MKFFTQKLLFKLIAITLLLSVTIFILNYFTSSKVKSTFFKKNSLNTLSFMESYDNIKLQYKGEELNLYFINHVSAKDYIFYMPDSDGILDNVVNSMALKYNLIILDYPENPKFQNFADLQYIFGLAMTEIKLEKINLKKVILFGQGIGGNVILSSSDSQDFEGILLFNILQNERDYCHSYFNFGLCMLVNSSFTLETFNKNLVYYFFNENTIISSEKNYDMFNSINAYEKFLFEIPGDNLHFNFNHILEFYNNESLIQDENFELSQGIEGDEDVIDVDGLLNPDKYMD